MKNLYAYKEFVNEAKKAKEMTDVERVMDGVKNILEGYFTFAKKPKYEHNKDGFPTEVTFMVAKEDYKLEWTKEPLKTDYSEIVALKHVYDVELIYKSKEEKEDEMWMTFTVKFKKVTEKEKLPKLKDEQKKKKKAQEDEDEEPRSKDEEWYGKDDDDIDDEEIDKKAKAKAEKK